MKESKHKHFDEAVEFLKLKETVTCSELQIKFILGYNSVGRLVDELEEAGIIGGFNGAKARIVLSTSTMTDIYHPHKHIEILPGCIANVSPDCSQETIDALTRLCEKVKSMTAKQIADLPRAKQIKKKKNENRTNN